VRLYLPARADGAKHRRLKHRPGGRERVAALGDDRAVGLAEARARRDEACREPVDGIDPI